MAKKNDGTKVAAAEKKIVPIKANGFATVTDAELRCLKLADKVTLMVAGGKFSMIASKSLDAGGSDNPWDNASALSKQVELTGHSTVAGFEAVGLLDNRFLGSVLRLVRAADKVQFAINEDIVELTVMKSEKRVRTYCLGLLK